MDSSYTNLLNNGRYGNHDDMYLSQTPPISLHSTPQDVLPNQSQVCSLDATTKKKPRTKNFSTKEDLLLISAWLNVSTDPIQGNNQTQQTYWNRIATYFHEHREFFSDRNPNSLMNRWSSIQLAVSKFQGYYNQIEGRNQSGVSEQDKVCQAMDMYQSLQNKAFPFIHCWTELRTAPKFASNISKKKSKTSHNASPASSSPSTPESVSLNDVLNVELSLERPMGRKATKELFNKAKRKEKEVADEEIKELLLELKEAQLVAKNERNERIDKLLRLETERQERERRKEEREERLYEERILSIDTSKMDAIQTEYYNSLKAKILEKIGKC